MEKEFGKLTLDQVRGIVTLLLEMRAKRGELIKEARADKKGRLNRAPEDFSWAELYSLPLQEMVALMLSLGGLDKVVQASLTDDDPQQYILDNLTVAEPNIRDLGDGEEDSLYTFTALVVALGKSLEAIEIYGCSLNRLMIEASQGDDEALLKIVRIDHSAVCNPTIARRISIAELRDDTHFFKLLANALTSRPQKHTVIYGPIRYMLAVFQELGIINHFDIDDYYQLFCIDLKLYPIEGKDPAGSLKQFIDRWKKTYATSNGDFMS